MTDRRLTAVARHDFKRTVARPLPLAAFGLVTLLILPTFWSMVGGLHAGDRLAPPAVRAVANIPGYLATYVFVFVVAVTYGAIAWERETGTIRFLLGLPTTRRDVLFGTLLSRNAVTAAGIGIILLVAGVIVLVRRGAIPLVAFGLTSLWILVYVSCWTTFAVGVSAAFDSSYRALGAVVGPYVVFAWNAPIWKAVLEPGLRAVFPKGMEPFVASLNPTLSLGIVSERLVAENTVLATDVATGQLIVSIVVTLLIAAGGVILGIHQFEQADIR